MQIAYKCVVAGAVLITPLSFYYFTRSFQVERVQSALAMVGMVILLVAPVSFVAENNAIGGTFFSTFHVGLVANALALPLLLTYIGAVVRSLGTRRILLPGFALASIILCHTLTLLPALLFLAFAIAASIVSRSRVFHLLAHGLLAGLLTLFWTVPFLAFLPESRSGYIVLKLGAGGFVLLASGLALLSYLHMKGRLVGLSLLGGWFLVLTTALLALNYIDLPVHYYRLILYPTLVVPVFAARALPRSWHAVVAPAGLVVLVASWPASSPATSPTRCEVQGATLSAC